MVEPGTYPGFSAGYSTPAVAGTAAAPVTFKALPGAVIDARNGDTADGIDLEPGDDYWVIDGFSVQNTSGTITRAGIRVTGSANVVVQNNNVDDCGTWGIFTGFAENVLIQNNVCSRSQAQHGIYVSNSADNPVIRGNTCWGNHDCGIQINADVSQGGDGIITGALVEGNIIHDNGAGGGAAINFDGVQQSVVRNNLVYNNHANGIALFMQDGAAPSMNNVVVNNTVVMASDARWDITIANGSTGNTLLNNILLNNNPNHGSVDITADSLPGLASDYNVVADRFTPDDGGTFESLAAWQAGTGQDKHSFVAGAAQLFVNAAGNNYQLAAASPAVGKGTSLDAPPTDLLGNPRPSGSGYDIGAYQSVSAEQPPRGGIRFLYSQLLGRAASTGEVNSWVGVYTTGGPAAVAGGILRSPEALGRVVDGLYQNLLGRAADAAGRAYWVGRLEVGEALEDVQASILASAEFQARSADFVQALYQAVLGRAGSAQELAFWHSQLPTLGAAGVAAAFTHSYESRLRFVSSTYQTFLGRPASPAEAASWAGLPADLLGLEQGIIGSAEFFANH
jgi:parallel beta-helix repeat protein